jgi:hypothetical protein
MKLLLMVMVLFIGGISIAGQDVVLTFRQEGKDFEDVYRELQGEVELKEVGVEKTSPVSIIADAMKIYMPKVVILMDNSSIVLFRKYQQTLKEDDKIVPSIALMGVMVKAAIRDIKKASGISYEIPIVTSIVSLRSVLGIKMKKVGVVHREFLKGFMEENAAFCKKEGIKVVNIALPNKSRNYKSLLEKALKELMKQEVDALWVPNDNAVLHPAIIKSVWIPCVRKYKIPIVVGVEVLVRPKLNFGTFAVLPDHVSLGIQAAEMVFDLMDNNWEINKSRVDPPLAVYKIINLQQAEKYFTVTEENLKSVDKILK